MNTFCAVCHILMCAPRLEDAAHFDIRAKRCYLFEPQCLLEEEMRYPK